MIKWHGEPNLSSGYERYECQRQKKKHSKYGSFEQYTINQKSSASLRHLKMTNV